MSSSSSSSYANPKKGAKVTADVEKMVCSPAGCDEAVTFKGMGVKGQGHDFEVVTYNPRPLGDDDVEIKIAFCGICASDIHTVDAGWATTANEQVVFPVIPGHEIVGVVTKAGKSSLHKVGDRVGVGAQVWSCLQNSCDPCHRGWENHCLDAVYTYNSPYTDGQYAFGGYADNIRVHSRFAFKIPENIPSELAAPLLCAGATVFAPLQRYVKKPGMNVGVIGIGGLGHLAIQFAHKMGCKVTAISSSDKKREDATKLGATDYINMSDRKDVKRGKRTLDLIINSVTSTSKDVAKDYEDWFSLLNIGGTIVMVGLPDDHVRFNVFALVGNQASFTGSSIGSVQEIRDMLEFASKHDVRPWIAIRPLSSATATVQEVREGKPRFRYVLEIGK